MVSCLIPASFFFSLTLDAAVLVETARTLKAHIAETLVSVIIQNRLTDISAIALMSVVLRTVPLKVVPRQMLLPALTSFLAFDCQSLPPKSCPTPTVFQDLRHGGSQNAFAGRSNQRITCPFQSSSGEYLSSHTCATTSPYLWRYIVHLRPKDSLRISTV